MASAGPSSPPAQPLAGLIDEELRALREFVALLKEEQGVLVQASPDALRALVDKKSALAFALADLGKRREAALAGQGLSGRAGMETWLASLPADAPQRARWAELMALAAEARDLNQINGKLINTRLQHNQQALSALTGASQQAMTTYGPDGHTQTQPGSRRILGSA